MSMALVELLINLLMPIIKNLLVFYTGKSSGKNEKELEFIKKNNEKIIEVNKLLNKKMEISNEINNMDIDDVYNEWLF